MKNLLYILALILFISCTEEKIIYVEQDSKTLEGTWDIEGVWLSFYHDNQSKTTTYDTITHGRDTFEFFYNRTNGHNSNLYMSLLNKDTVYHFAGTLNYPFNRYASTTNIDIDFKILNFLIEQKNIVNNQYGDYMEFHFEYSYEDDDNSKPIIFSEDETNVSFSIEYDYKINEYRKKYNFIGKGKRIK